MLGEQHGTLLWIIPRKMPLGDLKCPVGLGPGARGRRAGCPPGSGRDGISPAVAEWGTVETSSSLAERPDSFASVESLVFKSWGTESWAYSTLSQAEVFGKLFLGPGMDSQESNELGSGEVSLFALGKPTESAPVQPCELSFVDF